MLVSCLDYYSALKMEATCSSKALVNFQFTAWSYIPEERQYITGNCGVRALRVCIKSTCHDTDVNATQVQYLWNVRSSTVMSSIRVSGNTLFRFRVFWPTFT
jgi:hypothetical protein